MGFWANIFYGMLILILLYFTSIIALRILYYIIYSLELLCIIFCGITGNEVLCSDLNELDAIIRRDIEKIEYICNCLCNISYCCIYNCKKICKYKYNKRKCKVKPIIYDDKHIIIVNPHDQCYIGTKCEIVNL